jgi:hypothetical protein
MTDNKDGVKVIISNTTDDNSDGYEKSINITKISNNSTNDDGENIDEDVEEVDDDEVADLMRDNVQRLLQLEEEIKVLSASLKARRDKKKEICDVLMVYLAKRNIGHVHLDGAYKGTKLVHQIGETKSKFTPVQIKQILQDNINKPDVVNRIYELILSKQTVKQTSKLKLDKPKKGKVNHSVKMEEALQVDENDDDDLPPHLQYLADV